MPASRAHSTAVPRGTPASPESPAPPAQASGDSWRLKAELAPEALIQKLSKIADRGRLPGFERAIEPAAEKDGAKPAAAFRVTAFGAPYDEELLGSVFPVGTGSEARFRMRRLRKVPVIMAVVLILTVWPGMWLTDSMLRIYFSWYRIETWWWYIPLTVLSLPVLWRQWSSSHRAAVEEAKTLIERMRAEVGGRVEPLPSGG